MLPTTQQMTTSLAYEAIQLNEPIVVNTGALAHALVYLPPLHKLMQGNKVAFAKSVVRPM